MTNKPVRISRHILDELGISNLFFQVYGGNSFEFKKPHPVGIRTLQEEATAVAADTWMVGDSGVDVQTARNAGVSSCGVLWGFQPETFGNDPPDLLIASMEELEDRLTKLRS
jgi:phosphoglycolate phosphatase